MNDQEEVTIRPFAAGDETLVWAFFDQMGGETRALFNRGDGNRRTAMRFFEGAHGFNGDLMAALRT
jgi:hypothetical protein